MGQNAPGVTFLHRGIWKESGGAFFWASLRRLGAKWASTLLLLFFHDGQPLPIGTGWVHPELLDELDIALAVKVLGPKRQGLVEEGKALLPPLLPEKLQTLMVEVEKFGQIRLRGAQAQKFVNGDGLLFALHPHQVQLPQGKPLVQMLGGVSADNDLGALDFGQTFQAGRQVDVVADGGVVEEGVGPHVAHRH